MKKEKKVFKMPKDIRELWIKHDAMDDIVDRLLDRPFRLEKAIKLKIENQKLHQEIWAKTYLIYPELRCNKSLVADAADETIRINDV